MVSFLIREFYQNHTEQFCTQVCTQFKSIFGIMHSSFEQNNPLTNSSWDFEHVLDTVDP